MMVSLTKYILGFESNSFEFAPTLPRAFIMDKSISAIIAQAAAMGKQKRKEKNIKEIKLIMHECVVDWNTRNKYCSACGKITILAEAGYKRSCTSDPEEATKCISHTGVQNFAYPRTGRAIMYLFCNFYSLNLFK